MKRISKLKANIKGGTLKKRGKMALSELSEITIGKSLSRNGRLKLLHVFF